MMDKTYDKTNGWDVEVIRSATDHEGHYDMDGVSYWHGQVMVASDQLERICNIETIALIFRPWRKIAKLVGQRRSSYPNQNRS